MLKKNIYFLTILGISGIVAIYSTIMPVWWQNKQMKKQIKQLEKEIFLLKKEKEHYIIQKKRIEQNPGYIEFLLRNRLQYGKKGEKILD